MTITNPSSQSSDHQSIKTRLTIQMRQQQTRAEPEPPDATAQPMTFHVGEEAIGGVYISYVFGMWYEKQ